MKHHENHEPCQKSKMVININMKCSLVLAKRDMISLLSNISIKVLHTNKIIDLP